jgi:hypothetical protein
MLVPHVVLSATTGNEHAPVPAVQVPEVWHASGALHVAVPQHTPLTQKVPFAQLVLPEHVCPSGAVAWHFPALQ